MLAGVALLQDGLEVGERRLGAVAERHRLLDLELDRDPPVVGAVVVLDRHEVEEADQLLRAPRLLLGENGAAVNPSSAASASSTTAP